MLRTGENLQAALTVATANTDFVGFEWASSPSQNTRHAVFLCCRGRYECCRALLRAGADPNYMNNAGDLVLFWAIDGGVEIIKLMYEYGADLDARTPKDWTPLSYCKAKGKYGATEEKGIYPEV